MDETLRELERACRATPADREAQLRYARALGRAGERLAWGRELCDLASDLVPEAVSALLETDDGLRWSLAMLAGYSPADFVHRPPATDVAIAAAEERIGFALPALLRRIYTVANGLELDEEDGDRRWALRPVEELVEVRWAADEALEDEDCLERLVVLSTSDGVAFHGGPGSIVSVYFGDDAEDEGVIRGWQDVARSFEEWFLSDVVMKAIGKRVRWPETPFAIKGLDEAFPDARVEPGELPPRRPEPARDGTPQRLRPVRDERPAPRPGAGIDFDIFAQSLDAALASRGWKPFVPLPPTHPVSLRAAWKRASLREVEGFAVVPYSHTADVAPVVARAIASVAPAFGTWRKLVGLKLHLVLAGFRTLPLAGSLPSLASSSAGGVELRSLHVLDLDASSTASLGAEDMAAMVREAVSASRS